MSREEIYSAFVQKFGAPRSEPASPVTGGDLFRVEEQLKITFPASYLTFFTRYGPVFTPSILDLVTGGESEQAPEGASFDVREFFEPDEILATHRLYASGGMEDWLIPIAMDCMGNVFGFKREQCASRPDDSPLWFFDHDYCMIHQVSVAFDAWLASFLQLAKSSP